MGKTASAASAHLAPCFHSASPRAIPVPKNPAVMVSAEMRLEGEASPQPLTTAPLPPPHPHASPDCLPFQVPL